MPDYPISFFSFPTPAKVHRRSVAGRSRHAKTPPPYDSMPATLRLFPLVIHLFLWSPAPPLPPAECVTTGGQASPFRLLRARGGVAGSLPVDGGHGRPGFNRLFGAGECVRWCFHGGHGWFAEGARGGHEESDSGEYYHTTGTLGALVSLWIIFLEKYHFSILACDWFCKNGGFYFSFFRIGCTISALQKGWNIQFCIGDLRRIVVGFRRLFIMSEAMKDRRKFCLIGMK